MEYNKLTMYSTAFSPMYKQYVKIVKVRMDADNYQPIVEAQLPDISFRYDAVKCPKTLMFREWELVNYTF